MGITSGTQLGPYTIQSQIGAGGMGEVYRARDTRLGRDVAVKVLPESFSRDDDRLRRFEQEAQAVAALNHPNIVAIFDIGHKNGSPYLVSEFLEGESLRAALDHGALPQRKVTEYAVQIASGLAAAHEKGIVHRDLKPDNLFVCRDGRVKILDFGVAKLAAQTEPDGKTLTSSQTAAGVVLGTASYMAPEQVRGERVDPRTDIFSFGAVLFEMASHKRAFQRPTTAETMTAILREDPPEVTDVQPPIAPATERIIRRCLEKNPEDRFQSAKDLAFGLEALSQVSTSQTGAQAALGGMKAARQRNFIILAGVAGVVALAMLGVGWWIGRASSAAKPPEYEQITFRTGNVGNARFAPDGSIVYSATWEDGVEQIYLSRPGDNGATSLGIKDAELLSISKNGELAIRLHSLFLSGYIRSGTLARVPLSGGTPRETLDSVEDAEWAPDGENMAVVRFVPETSHWRLEYPVGKVLVDSINWISNPKISPDGKLVAFADHENPGGDDEGSVAVVGADGRERRLSSGWSSLEGIEWSPAGNEIWFAASNSGAANNMRGVTLGGKLRTIANVPGGMWLEDLRGASVLMIVHRQRVNIRGMAPGGQERELGWLGWSELRDISRDGKKILFEEEAEGGGPNYSVFLRDLDGSPPELLGPGTGQAISPDGKWVVTVPTKVGPLNLVPTGAGESRQLTHDNVTYSPVTYFPDDKRLLARGIEPGHGARDYVIDVATGASKPVTPEGVVGTALSPDGREVAVQGPDGNWGIWSFEANSMQAIPGLDAKYIVTGWAPDGETLYVSSTRRENDFSRKVYRADPATGKMEFWKEFGGNLPVGAAGVGPPQFSADGKAYAYVYSQILSEAYVITGLK